MKLEAGHLHDLLREADPESAAVIHPNNKKRAARAVSFFQTTGQRISLHNARQKQNIPVYETVFIILTSDRSALYTRIDRRVEEMIERGLVDEVKGLLEKGCHPSLTSMQGIGYKEIVRYIYGEYSLDYAVSAIQQATRHYAKRQLTWFNHQVKDGAWVNIDGKSAEEIVSEIMSVTVV
jgi:tRNA dimethylallyltransferase